jgi:GT2 family glycosyltransferase/glycosyltransferase involved in cell wall biosynthesis
MLRNHMPEIRTGVVSVVIVNFRGAADTLQAIANVNGLDWPEELLEVIVVENGSGDDSLDVLRARAPHVTIVESSENLGFAGGCNLGVSHSSGEFVAFLNNDAKPDSAWVRAAVARFQASSTVGAVASRVLDWDGELVDFIGSAMTWYGMGYKPFTADPVPQRYEAPARVLFGTGSAMFVRRSVFDELDGFDESYFMFFEDVDLGWRLNLLGYTYAYEPASFAYHKHHASMTSYGPFKEQYLLERNALFTLYKNMEAQHLNEALPAAMALSIRRGMSKTDLSSTSLDLREGGRDDEEMSATPKILLSSVYGIDQFVEQLPALKKTRDQVQSTRRVSDSQIWKLFGIADAPVIQNDYYLEGYEKIVTAFDVSERPPATRVLIVTGDPIGAKLAGPAIRAWNMAAALADANDVTLLSLSGVEDLPAPFDLVHVRAGDERAFAPFEANADIIIFQGHAMAVFPVLQSTTKLLVVDIYDPMHLEQLEQARELPREVWSRQVSDATAILNQQLARGDFFLCASERQKHFYLGQLAALGRISPDTYDGDPHLDGLVAVVPFGLDRVPPVHKRSAMKGVVEGIGATDKVLLWSGGLYNWFDPATLIEAVALLSTTRPEVKLYFQGTKHPHPGVPEMRVVADSRALATRLGVNGTNVFFNASWVDYSERQNFLTEADAGVSTHHSHIETTFSFRTRILDYLWAGLPMVVTEGDFFAELIEKEDLGLVVPDRDAKALAAALEKVLFDEDARVKMIANVQRVRERFYWDVVLQPLVDYVAQPQPAADRHSGTAASRPDRPRKRIKKSGLKHNAGLVVFYLRNGGPRLVVRKVRSRLGRR